MKKALMVFLFFIIMASSGRLYAHGLFHEIRQDGAVTVRLKYHDGGPARNVAVKVFAPGNDKAEYQSGKTDRNGTFSFLADAAGEWKIRVNYGVGNGITIKAPIGDTMLRARPDEGHGHGRAIPWWQQLLMAASIVWGFMGFFFFFQNRKG